MMSKMFSAIALVSSLAVAACSPPMEGNERGGVVVTAPAYSAAFVNAKVEEHCAKYGRRPSVPPNAQPFTMSVGHQHYQFDCVDR